MLKRSTCFHLADFPAEVLSIVLQHLYGDVIGRLWLSGDKKLHYLLREGRSVKILELNYRYQSTNLYLTFPRFLINLDGLLELFITEPLRSSYDIDLSDWDRVPSTIEKLWLDFSQNDSFFSWLKSRQIAGKPALLALQYLYLSLKSEEITIKQISTLPQALQTLKLSSLVSSLDMISHLPRTLTNLYLSTKSNEFNRVDFPSGLKKFVLETESQCQGNSSLVNILDSLPPCLETLDVFSSSYDFKNVFDHLPKSLKKLNLQEVNSELQNDFSKLNEMMPNLIHIDITFLDSVSHRIFSKLPSRVITAAIQPVTYLMSGANTNEYFLDSNFHFPPLATDLGDVSWHESFPETLIPLLPKHLTKISLIRAKNMTEKFVALLPRTIHTLSLYSINDLIVDALPPHLTTLKAYLGNLSEVAIKKLPQTIKMLGVSSGSTEKVNFWWSLRNMASLQLDNFQENFKTYPSIEYEELRSMPASIKTLDIAGRGFGIPLADIHQWRSLFVGTLLTTLRISGRKTAANNKEISVDILYSIPSTITLLSLNPTQGKLTDDHMKCLPRTIRSFSIDGPPTELTKESIQFWPHTLSYTAIPTSLNLACDCEALFSPNLIGNLFVGRQHFVDFKRKNALIAVVPLISAK
jgi:hypothetical protein